MFGNSAMAVLLADWQRFWLAGQFLRPLALTLAVIPLTLFLLEALADQRQRRRLEQLGTTSTLQELQTHPATRPGLTRLLIALGWLTLLLGLAGPSWSPGEPDGVVIGRDLIVLVDLSRSMLAEDTTSGSRAESARAGVQELLDSLRSRGGHRVGVILFAARPTVWVPLTADYDHIAQKLREFDPAHPPLATRPLEDSQSGTRIGAAIKLAASNQDQRFPAACDLLLLSDGDDPLPDREWLQGITAARQGRVPVHVVGLGDPVPDRAVTIIRDGQLLESPDANGIPQPVRSYLHEEALRQIAAETGGVYLPAHRDRPRLAEFFRQTIEPKPSRELADDALPQPRDQAPWFYALAAGCWLAAWRRR